MALIVVASPPSGALFFTSLLSAPPDSYVTLFGYGFPNPAVVKVNGKTQTVVNEAYSDPYLTMHPGLIKLGHNTNTYDLTWNESSQIPYQRVDVLLDNVVSGDTGLQVEGVGVVTHETGTALTSLVEQTDTLTGFTVHTGNTYFVDEDDVADGVGTEADPFNSFVTAAAAISDGDVVYVRETTAMMSMNNFTVNADSVAWSWASSTSGTASQPNALCAYPNEYPKWDQTVGDGLIGMNGGGAEVSYQTIFGLEIINTGGLGSGSAMQSGNATGQDECRQVACRCQGYGSFSGGTWGNLPGGNAGAQNSRVIGCSADETAKNNLTEGMAHVWYAVGNGVLTGCFFLHCRNTEHNVGRVIQAYGHNTGEEVHNLHVSFCNIEGAKSETQQPAGGVMLSHTDAVGGQAGGSWVQDAHMEYSTFSGCSTGLRLWSTDSQPGVGEGGSLTPIVVVDNCVGYDNSSTDISVEEYYRATISNCLVESSITFDFTPDGVDTIDDNNTVGPPTDA